MPFATKKIIIPLVSFASFVFLFYAIPSLPLEKILSFIIQKTQIMATSESSKINRQITSASLSKQQLLKQISDLKADVNDLNADIAELKGLKNENEELRVLLSFAKTNDHKTVFAAVVSKSNLSSERSIAIDKGTENGIRIGNPVITGKGTLIGKVVYATKESSRVRLTTDSESSILATIADSGRTIAGSLQGSLGSGIVLNFIPKDIIILKNQQVLTNGFEADIPPNLFLGKVSELKESKNEVFNSAIIEPPYAFEDVTAVGVITSR